MAIPIASGFKLNAPVLIDADMIVDSMGDLLLREFKKEGLVIWVRDIGSAVVWDGTDYVPVSGSETVIGKVVELNETTRIGKVEKLDASGQPTGEFLEDVYILEGGEGGGEGGTGIEEAPEDGKLYGRKDADWEEVVSPIEEAPNNGKLYGRKNAAWSELPPRHELLPKEVRSDIVAWTVPPYLGSVACSCSPGMVYLVKFNSGAGGTVSNIWLKNTTTATHTGFQAAIFSENRTTRHAYVSGTGANYLAASAPFNATAFSAPFTLQPNTIYWAAILFLGTMATPVVGTCANNLGLGLNGPVITSASGLASIPLDASSGFPNAGLFFPCIFFT